MAAGVDGAAASRHRRVDTYSQPGREQLRWRWRHRRISSATARAGTAVGSSTAGSLSSRPALCATIAQVRAGTTGTLARQPTVGAPGGDGGGIANQGQVIMVASTVSGNMLARAAMAEWHPYVGGEGGAGGGIFNNSSMASLRLVNSTVSGNRTGDGGSSRFSPGPGGNGGGIDNHALLTASNVTVTGNRTGNGGPGYGGPAPGAAAVSPTRARPSFAIPSSPGTQPEGSNPTVTTP